MKMIQATALFLVMMSGCTSPDTVPVKQTAASSDSTKLVATMATPDANDANTTNMDSTKIIKSDADWEKQLTSNQYFILREKGTERAFTGEYWDNHAEGVYKCAACGTVLFSSKEKFDSGCGWPSFSMPFDSATCDYHTDNSFGMTRTEVTCHKCGGHLGHVFDDGPPPTGQRYCINSGALIFVPGKQ